MVPPATFEAVMDAAADRIAGLEADNQQLARKAREVEQVRLANEMLALELNRVRENPPTRELAPIAVKTQETVYIPMPWPERGAWILIWLGTILLFLSGCAYEPEEGYQFLPPPSYRAMWEVAQECTGLRSSFDAILFVEVPGDMVVDGKRLAGLSHDATIYIKSGYLDHPKVVRHEMIHALGIDGHPEVPFGDPCKATWETWDRTEPKLDLTGMVGGSAGGVK